LIKPNTTLGLYTEIITPNYYLKNFHIYPLIAASRYPYLNRSERTYFYFETKSNLTFTFFNRIDLKENAKHENA